MNREFKKINALAINPGINTESMIMSILGSTNAGTEQLLLEITELGLKRKGFNFATRTELKSFISTRCKMVLSKSREVKTLFVDDQPFVSFREKVEHVDLGEEKPYKWWVKNSLEAVEYL